MEKCFAPPSCTESTYSSPVDMRECFEELIKFILESSINDILEFDLCLSNSFCSALLVDDPDDSFSEFTADSCEGVPRYPLYKRLASALCESLSSGTLCQKYSGMETNYEESFLKQKEEEWLKLIIDKGSEIPNTLKTPVFELHAQEPFLSQLKEGQKTIDGRCAVGHYSRIRSGTLILYNKYLVFEVQGVQRYATFSDMLKTESLEKVLPGVRTIEEGVEICKKLNREEEEGDNGVLAICIWKVILQPYISLANVLNGLSYEGVQCLLGLKHTMGTIVYAVPPPRSALLSSFMLPYKPEAKGITLTHGARALAKHSHRSSNKYWGNLDGNDSNKNTLALSIISHLIAQCCWLNAHIVPLHGIVFEIRVADGYGARWSKDGSKFIGFLEPYTEDGHLKLWKH